MTCLEVLDLMANIVQMGEFLKLTEKAASKFHKKDYFSSRLYLELA